MLSWATSQFEKLSQTVAPPPTDPTSRFVYCCQRGEENEAMQLASQLPGSGVIVNPSKQQVPLQVSCTYGLMELTRQLLNQPGASLDMIDGSGNTVLHCAAMCNQQVGLDLVKMLVTEMGANVCAKNFQGQTPYDVATLNSIRQYLLPIQLQQETKEALANGGTGLPPGIDMGGLKIQNTAMLPPPMHGGAAAVTSPPPQVGPPPQGMPGVQSQQPGRGASSPYPQPPNPFAPPAISTPTTTSPVNQGVGAVSPYPQPPYPGGMVTPTSQPTTTTTTQVAPVQGAPPPMPSPAPPLATKSAPARAPTSAGKSQDDKHAYALSGYSSAAIYKAAPGSGGIRPDGFHSSSSDKRLAQKYGHAQADYSHIPPPPSSGNSAGALAGAGMSAYGSGSVSAPTSGGSNPYAGGLASRQRQNRYVNYNPVTGQTPGVAPSRPFSSYGAPISSAPIPAAGQFNVFTPGGAATTSQTAPAPASAGMASAPSPMPPPPFQLQVPHQSTPTAAAAQQPAVTQQTSPYGLSPQPVASAPAQTVSPFAQPSPMGGSNPAAGAAAMFSTPAATQPAQQQATSASSRFATPPLATTPAQQQATPQSASSRFATPPQQVTAVATPTNTEQAAIPAAVFSSPPMAGVAAAAATFSPPPASAPVVPTQVPFSNRDVSGISSLSSASDLFAKPAGASASDAFAGPPANVATPSPVTPAQAFGQPPPGGSPAKPVAAERSATPQKDIAEAEDFDKLDDIPLSPPMNTRKESPGADPAMGPPPLSST